VRDFEQGFTLLELMVAMAIFAALAVSGWQVFDGVNRARDRAQVHAERLAELQFAYLQLQQDLSQIAPYQIPIEPNLENNQDQPLDPKPFAKLDSQSFSFVRFADPDPRFQSSPALERIDYVFDNERLIRKKYLAISSDRNTDNQRSSLDSVVLTHVSEGRWQAYLPKLSATFPNEVAASGEDIQNPPLLLPKGVQLTFKHQGEPITWQWAIVSDSQIVLQAAKNKASPPSNNNANNQNTANNANANANNNAASSDNNSSPTPNDNSSNRPDGLL